MCGFKWLRGSLGLHLGNLSHYCYNLLPRNKIDKAQTQEPVVQVCRKWELLSWREPPQCYRHQALALGQQLRLSGLRFPVCTVTVEAPRSPPSVCVTLLASVCNKWTWSGRSWRWPRSPPAEARPRALELPSSQPAAAWPSPRLGVGPPPGRSPYLRARGRRSARPPLPVPLAPPLQVPGWGAVGGVGGVQLGRFCVAQGAAGSPGTRVRGYAEGHVGRERGRQDSVAGAGASPDARGNQLGWGHHCGGSRSRKEEQRQRGPSPG